MIDWCALKEALESGLQGTAEAFRKLQEAMMTMMELSEEMHTVDAANPLREYARKTATKRYRNHQHLYSKTPKTKYKPPIRRIN